MSLQGLLSSARKAIVEHKMIEDGDRIAVGLSGGKDSIALLAVLAAYRKFSPEKFDLIAITIDPGFPGENDRFSALTEYVESLGVEHVIVRTDIAKIVFEERKESNPCSLCSKMRRGALNNECNARGFNKLALGHHAEDLSETLFLSLFYEGRLSTFQPKSLMDRTGITLIRPLIYTFEKDVIGYTRDLPIVKNPCPADENTKREYVRDVIRSVQKEIPFVKDRIHSAIIHPERNNLWEEYEPFKRTKSKKTDDE